MQESQKPKLLAKILPPLFLLVLVIARITYAIITTTTLSSGIIVLGSINLQVYKEDKTTVLTNINWGELSPSATKIEYAWIYTGVSYCSLTCFHDAPPYLTLKLFAELSPNLWTRLALNENITLNHEWTHIYFELIVSATPQPGPFSFYIYLVT